MKKEEMQELIDIFEQHKAVLTDLREFLEEEREALVNDDTVALGKAIHKKTECAQQLERFEKLRTEQYAGVTLRTLEESFTQGFEDEEEETLQERLKEQMLAMQTQSEALRHELQTNTILIQQNMAYAGMMLQTLQDVIKKSGTYGKDGRIDQSSSVKAGLDRSV